MAGKKLTLSPLMFLFFFVFLMLLCVAAGMPVKPFSFDPSSPLPPLNFSLGSTLSEQEGLASVWPLHSMPAVGNLNGSTIHSQSYAYLCYVNTSTDSFILVVVITGEAAIGLIETGMIVWMANRDIPATGGFPSLQIEEREDQYGFKDSNLVLRGGNGVEVWRVNASSTARVELQGNGNLLVYNSSKRVVWQSYDHPADTLVLGQTLHSGSDSLVSRASTSDLSRGSYSLQLAPNGAYAYYRHSAFLHPYLALSFPVELCPRLQVSFYFNYQVSLEASCEEGYIIPSVTFGSTKNGSIPILRLQPNGDLQMYQFDQSVWSPPMSAFSSLCELPGSCAAYSTCFPSNKSCSSACVSDSGELCTPPTTSISYGYGASCHNPPGSDLRMETLHSRSYFGNAFDQHAKNVSNEGECRDACLYNCTCTASFYNAGNMWCFLVEDVLQLTEVSNHSQVAFIKVPTTTTTTSNNSGLELTPPNQSSNPNPDPGTALPVHGMNQRPIFILAVTFTSFLALFFIAGSLLVRYTKKNNARTIDSGETSEDEDASDDVFLQAFQNSLPTRFSYQQIEAMTKSFSKELGCGGFGSVFEGELPNSSGIKVAVKRLDVVTERRTKEFRAEVVVLGNLHHFNLVKLLGYCGHGSHRILIYEYMANGSLDTWIFGSGSSLPWRTRHRIAVGVASGLAYLHDDCSNKVIHLDIKPQNILLDEDFTAKVGDFGLSRLMKREESSAFTTVRGTPGYIAPEWLLHGVVSEKMDVYSFGMVLFEIVSGHRNYDIQDGEEDEKRHFRARVLEKVQQGKELELVDSKLLDSLRDAEDASQIKTMIRVSILCTQEDAKCRPRMSSVVKMLEGEKEVPCFPLDQHSNDSILHERVAHLAIAFYPGNNTPSSLTGS